MTTESTAKKVEREARLRWVPIPDMRISPMAQRELNQARVDRIASTFDLEQIGTPTVNERDGLFYVIDGQHRIEALKEIGWGDQQLQCWAYVGLTEQEEAEKFLKLNDTLTVDAFSKFKIGVQAGRPLECDIDRIVRLQGLTISRAKSAGAIHAVGTLRRIYVRSDPATLRRTLAIIRDAFGDSGFEALVLDGIGLLCQRYNAELNDEAIVTRLSSAHGGVKGLLGMAEGLHKSTGSPKAHCVAASAVTVYNRGRGKKLPSWWREDGDGRVRIAPEAGAA